MEVFGHEHSNTVEVILSPDQNRLLIMKKIDPYGGYSYSYKCSFNIS